VQAEREISDFSPSFNKRRFMNFLPRNTAQFPQEALALCPVRLYKTQGFAKT
jgi:hypothetical protein